MSPSLVTSGQSSKPLPNARSPRRITGSECPFIVRDREKAFIRDAATRLDYAEAHLIVPLARGKMLAGIDMVSSPFWR
jgi:hypothetical protein